MTRNRARRKEELRFYGYALDTGTHHWKDNILSGATVFHRPPVMMGDRAEKVTIIILRGIHKKAKRK